MGSWNMQVICLEIFHFDIQADSHDPSVADRYVERKN